MRFPILSWLLIALVGCLFHPVARATGQLVGKPEALKELWGDRGDGSFVNPILPGDFSDLDAIRVGDQFYAISSSFQFSPGMVILQSRDLVNWSVAGHAVSDVTQISPEMNWDRMNRYGHGIWAGAIRYHDHQFWIYFGTPDEGLFVTHAGEITRPWSPVQAIMTAKGWDDCCPFWDDDGQGYLVCTNYSAGYKIHLFKLSTDNLQIELASDRVIHQSKGSEANKLYKINGLYYHYFSEVHSEGRVAMMQRAKSLDGPWEVRQLNHVNKRLDREPNQGGLIQLASGDWWFVTHQGTGDWEGRAMVLLPVSWVDGWPLLGKPGEDGIGNMVWSGIKPVAGQAMQARHFLDEFSDDKLKPEWEWNYQPRAEKWSLTERPGYLRLHSFKPIAENDLLKAANTLTLRSMRTARSEVVVKLDVRGMADGQQAGLCHFAKGWSSIGISQSGDRRSIVYREKNKVVNGPVVESGEIWLKSVWGYDGLSEYSFSQDGRAFISFGDRWQLGWGYYRGDRIGLFSFNNLADNGQLDVDQFEYDYGAPADAAHGK